MTNRNRGVSFTVFQFPAADREWDDREWASAQVSAVCAG